MKIARPTSPLPDMPRLSSPKPRRRHDRRHAQLSLPNLTLNLCTLSSVLSLARLPPPLASPTVPLPGSRPRSSPTTRGRTFLFLSQRPCVAEPEATCPSFAGPRSLRNLICFSTSASPPLNFLRLPQTFPPPLPLSQTKLPIPC